MAVNIEIRRVIPPHKQALAAPLLDQVRELTLHQNGHFYTEVLYTPEASNISLENSTWSSMVAWENWESSRDWQKAKARIEQLLDKLLGNAVEHSGEDGEIRVELRSLGDGSVELIVENEGDPLPEDKERIFEAFVSSQKHSENLGLGLEPDSFLLSLFAAPFFLGVPSFGFFLLAAAPLQRLVDRVQQHLLVDGFLQEIDGAGLHGLNAFFNGCMAGKQDDLHLGPFFLDGLQQGPFKGVVGSSKCDLLFHHMDCRD